MTVDAKQLKALSRLCRYAGERFDLAQAGGGNASVKTDDGLLIVKASGVALIDVGAPSSLSSLKMPPLLEVLKELSQDCSETTREALESKTFINEKMSKAKVEMDDATGRPSIETLLHAAMPKKFTLHTHPIGVCAAAFRSNWRQVFSKVYPEALLIPYATPGTPLSLSLYNALSNDSGARSQPTVVAFLQNHGLIVTADTCEQVQQITDDVCLKLEAEMGFDLSAYRKASAISALFKSIGAPDSTVAWVVQNRRVYDSIRLRSDVLNTQPCCPDYIVYCGVSIIVFDSLNDVSTIKNYFESNGEYPKVVMFDGNLYTVGNSIKKCREAEDLLAFHTESLVIGDDSEVSPLSDDEQQFLMHWEAEHYRRKV